MASNTYTNRTNSRIQCAQIELQTLVDASALVYVRRIQGMSGCLGVHKVGGDGTRLPQCKRIVDQSRNAMLGIDLHEIWTQLFFLEEIYDFHLNLGVITHNMFFFLYRDEVSHQLRGQDNG